jgi:hypothetical protein
MPIVGREARRPPEWGDGRRCVRPRGHRGRRGRAGRGRQCAASAGPLGKTGRRCGSRRSDRATRPLLNEHAAGGTAAPALIRTITLAAPPSHLDAVALGPCPRGRTGRRSRSRCPGGRRCGSSGYPTQGAGGREPVACGVRCPGGPWATTGRRTAAREDPVLRRLAGLKSSRSGGSWIGRQGGFVHPIGYRARRWTVRLRAMLTSTTRTPVLFREARNIRSHRRTLRNGTARGPRTSHSLPNGLLTQCPSERRRADITKISIGLPTGGPCDTPTGKPIPLPFHDAACPPLALRPYGPTGRVRASQLHRRPVTDFRRPSQNES